jgi:ferredoxin-type protein NapH
MTRFRRITQAAGALLGNGYFGVMTSGHIYRGSLKGVCVPFLSCYACPLAIFSCPIGTLQHFMTIRAVPFMLIGMLCLIGATVGRLACGWLCPFGLLQDLMYKIPSLKFKIHPALTGLKYATLVVLVLLVPFATGLPWFSKLCPAGTLTAGIPWVLANPHNPVTGETVIDPGDIGPLFAVKLVILGVFLVLFVMTKRPFCRTTCPLGGIFSLFNRFSIVQLKVSHNCRQCGQCKVQCPVDLQVAVEANSPECIRCLSCTSCKHVSVEINTPGLIRRPAYTRTVGYD